ncbi:MAG: DUF4124 domain-containing protein [Burkholderiaceae bacterium]
MTLHRFFLLAGLLLASVSAVAQYQWVDKDGRRVFSDRAPPADVPAKNILSQPRGGAVPAAVAATAPAPAASAAASKAPAAGTDKALEEKKKQAEAADAAKQKAEEARQVAARADNCKRAQGAKATLDSGMRMARINAKGEREVLDDAQRAAELKRVNEVIAASCK